MSCSSDNVVEAFCLIFLLTKLFQSFQYIRCPKRPLLSFIRTAKTIALSGTAEHHSKFCDLQVQDTITPELSTVTVCLSSVPGEEKNWFQKV